jgi:hypothetical protein
MQRIRSACAASALFALVVTGCGVDIRDAVPSTGETIHQYEVVAWGLNSPRGLAVDAQGGVYVSEAGTVGTECVNPKDGPCFGFTSAVQRYSGL